MNLFLTNKDIDRSSGEIPVITDLVFQILRSVRSIYHDLFVSGMQFLSDLSDIPRDLPPAAVRII